MLLLLACKVVQNLQQSDSVGGSDTQMVTTELLLGCSRDRSQLETTPAQLEVTLGCSRPAKADTQLLT